MKTLHRWFHSGNYWLLGHTDVPHSGRGRLGILIVPPFGWEDVCSYRPLRFLGRAFASHGISCLRFDLPGTGDSSGDAKDPRLFEAWIRSIGGAADELREASGVEEVAALGIGLGATLALAAAIRGANLKDLVLWAPLRTGHGVLREWRIFSRMERAEYADVDAPQTQPVPGLEVGGFLVAPETQRALEGLDLSAVSGAQRRRILVLSRDECHPDAKLLAALRMSGCSVAVGTGRGYAAMMALPNEARAPTEIGHAIAEFLKTQENSRMKARRRVFDTRPAATIGDGYAPVCESVYTIERSSGSMFGILTEPVPEAPRRPLCILFLNPGGVRHIGPNRMWVEAARRWARRGVISLRLDLEGIGESSGAENLDIPSLYQQRLVEQVEAAKESLRLRLGVRQFAAIGLCSGAFWALHLAIRHPEVRAAILVNPRLLFWDPARDRRRILRRVLRWQDWLRVARGRVRLETMKRAAHMVLEGFGRRRPDANYETQTNPETAAQAWEALERNQSRLTLVFTEGEPLLREMEKDKLLPPENGSRARCIRVANAGHTFRPLWAQKFLHELMDREVDQLLRESQTESIVRAS